MLCRSAVMLLLGCSLASTTFGLVIIESMAQMVLTYDDNSSNSNNAAADWTLPLVFNLEETSAQIFLQTLQDDPTLLGDGNEALSVSVAVQDATSSSTSIVISGIISCIYLSDRIPADLDTALMRGVNVTAFTETYPNAKLTFRPYGSWEVLDKYQDDSLTAASKGLIAATVLLSVLLVTVSAVLLHITGGWAVCQQRVCNCLFEEVDDDDMVDPNYGIDHKNTFQVDESAYGDHDGGDVEDNTMVFDEQSVATGMQTNPSGVLGVQQRVGGGYRNDNDNPAAGLGIIHSTPATNSSRGDYDYGDETPMSTSDRPLGITSMRELPQQNTPAEKGGLAHMIMERLTQYNNTGTKGTQSK